MKRSYILAYVTIFVALLTNCLLLMIDLTSLSVWDFVWTLFDCSAFSLILFAIMRSMSYRKVLDKFYYRENSGDIKKKIISYVLLLYTFICSVFSTIVYYIATGHSEFDGSLVIKTTERSLLITLFTVLLLIAISIRTQGDFNDFFSNIKESNDPE